MDDLTSVLASLREQEEARAAELALAETKCSEKRAELERIRKALSALGEGPRKKDRKQLLPAATNDDVSKLAQKILREKGGALPEAELRAAIYEEIPKLSKSKAGLSLRTKQALASEPFRRIEGNVLLRESETTV